MQRTLLSAALRGQQAADRSPKPSQGPWPDGLTDRAISDRLFLSNSTVKTHINRIFAKIGAAGREDAVAYVRWLT